MIEIPLVKRLEPYFTIAEIEAHKSPCVRRQYGAVIAEPNADFDTTFYYSSFNKRVSPCCDNNLCARDRVDTRHGGSTEIGGEIHAETSLLILRGMNRGYFILVGFEKGEQLLGNNVLPCHACAMALKFAGYRYIYIRNEDKQIVPISIKEIMDIRIAEWEPVD